MNTSTECLNLDNPETHRKLFDCFGNRFNIPIVEEYQRNSNREWVLQESNSYSENYYLLDDKLYLRFGGKLMSLETDRNNPELNVYWKLVGIRTDFKRITANEILFENHYRRLHKQSYSDGTCFYTLHQWVERPYPHYERDFKVEEGADNLQELIDYMNGQIEYDYKTLNESWVKNNSTIREYIEKTIDEETGLVEFMKQLTTLSA